MKFELSELKSFDEKWLLTEQLRMGHLWKDRLALAGHPQLNVHPKTYAQIARELASSFLAEANCILVSQSTLSTVIQCALQQLDGSGKLTYFPSSTVGAASLARLLAKTRHELRMSGVEPTQISDHATEVPAKAADLRAIYRQTEQLLQAANWVDEAWCFQQAIEGLESGAIALPYRLHILQPEVFPCLQLESQLLAQLIRSGANYHAAVTLLPSGDVLPPVTIHTAIGSINEVRGVLQTILAGSGDVSPLDTFEVVITHYEQYVPLLLEYALSVAQSPTGDDTYANLPMTFAEGIACVYSRPGRLLRSWVRWMLTGYHQTKAVEIVREGLLRRPVEAEQCGYARMASVFRSLPIGLGLERYENQLDKAIVNATAQRDAARLQQPEPAPVRDFGLASLVALQGTVQPLIKLAKEAQATPLSILSAARTLLEQAARAESQLDRYARAKLIDDIDLMIKLVDALPHGTLDVLTWLEALPTSSRILAQSPQPGKLHVTSLEQGGSSGRRNVCVLGLSDENFPKLQAMDPILLDHERQLLSASLPTAQVLNAWQALALERILTRMKTVSNSRVTLSYSQRDLIEDRQCSPAVAVKHCGPSSPGKTIAFVSDDPAFALSTDDIWYRSLLQEANTERRQAWLYEHYPHLLARQQARQAIHGEEYTPFDGWVPQAGIDAAEQMRERAFSPSRLEVLGTCPRRYFFQRTLGIRPPDECSIDPDRWLSPLDFGSLLHGLLEDVVRHTLNSAPHAAPSSSLTLSIMRTILDQQLNVWSQRVPPPDAQCLADTREELLTTCEIFLKAEEVYTQQRQARPVHLEVAFGNTHMDRPTVPASPWDSDHPITVTLSCGRTVQLIGRVDRVDIVSVDQESAYLIWDYKSGSNYGYAHDKPFDQGRHLQHLLYVRMLQARLAELGEREDSVHGFGYFFPTTKTEGLRIEWRASELMHGDRIVSSLLDLLVAGTFIATDNKNDCSMCDYTQVCGAPEQLVRITKKKMAAQCNEHLSAWRQLRDRS